MENGARYVVETRWGVFSLDEGAYQDYLAGRLWISWDPQKPATPSVTSDDYIPPHVSAQAVELRNLADRTGYLTALSQLGCNEAPVPYSPRLADLSIDELSLTVRSSNGLKRAGALTFGKLYELLTIENGIMNVRNLGQKSAKEIRQMFTQECYNRLLPWERAQYWQEVIDTFSSKNV